MKKSKEKEAENKGSGERKAKKARKRRKDPAKPEVEEGGERKSQEEEEEEEEEEEDQEEGEKRKKEERAGNPSSGQGDSRGPPEGVKSGGPGNERGGGRSVGAICTLGRWRWGQGRCGDGSPPDVTSGLTAVERERCAAHVGGPLRICQSAEVQPQGRGSDPDQPRLA